jgi:hypothetical protein
MAEAAIPAREMRRLPIDAKKAWTGGNNCATRGRHADKVIEARGGDGLGSIIKKRRKKMRKHKHKKLLAKTRHQRRST